MTVIEDQVSPGLGDLGDDSSQELQRIDALLVRQRFIGGRRRERLWERREPEGGLLDSTACGKGSRGHGACNERLVLEFFFLRREYERNRRC